MGARPFWQQFGVYSEWSLEALALPHLLALSIFCVLILVIECVRQKPLSNKQWHAYYWLVLTQLLFFPAIVAVGVLFPAAGTGPNSQANATGNVLLDVLLYGSLLTGAFWVYRMKELRWLAASIVVLQQIVLVCAGFISTMSVTGDWL
jgi:hypothetical protein